MKKQREWMVTSQDLHWNGQEAQATLQDGWEPFGVTYVPNLLATRDTPDGSVEFVADDTQIYLRLWVRRPMNHKETKPRVIRIQAASWGGHQVMLHLTAFWTPIGVDTSPGAPDQAIIWFVKDGSTT